MQRSLAVLLLLLSSLHLAIALGLEELLENNPDRFDKTGDRGGGPGRRPRPSRVDDEKPSKAAIQQQIDRAKRDIQLLIASDPKMAPKFIRLGFHDCVGGCDGCVDLDEADNNGLDIPIDALHAIVETHVNRTLEISRADIWVLAALTAAEMTQRLVQFPMTQHGRVDCEDTFQAERQRCRNKHGEMVACDAKHGPHRQLPMSDITTHGILKFFRVEFGFLPDEVVALMGAHSIGFAKRQHSGFEGQDGWTPQNLALNNHFYISLTQAPWKQIKIDNSDIDGIPDRFQWVKDDDRRHMGANEGDDTTSQQIHSNLRGLQSPPSTNTTASSLQVPRSVDGRGDDIFMLNADIALAWDFRNDFDERSGKVTCKLQPDAKKTCPFASTFHVANLYMQNEEKWMQDFFRVYNKMLNHGYAREECLSPPCKLKPAQLQME